MSLFEYKGYRVFLKPEIREIKEFRKLSANDRSVDKNKSTKLFLYIYHMMDYRSPYSIYNGDERHKKVIKDIDVDLDWRPESDVKDAMKKYAELNETPTIKSVKAIKDSLITSSKAINTLQKKIESDLNDENVDIDTVIANVENLLRLADKLPSAIKSLSALEEKAKSEQLGDTKIKGGGKINIFEE